MQMRFFILSLLIVFHTGISFSQDNVISELPRFQIEANIIGLHPTGPGKDFFSKFSWGGEGTLLYRIQHNKPLLIGLAAQTNTFERSFIREEAEYDDGTIFTRRETTASHLFNWRVVFRFQPEINWLLQPYLQGSIGLNHFFTNTKFRDEDTDEVYETFNEQTSTVIVYGLKAGLHFVPNDWYWRIHLGIGYLRNASTEFMTFNQDEPNFYPIDNFERIDSPIEFITFHLGALYMF